MDTYFPELLRSQLLCSFILNQTTILQLGVFKGALHVYERGNLLPHSLQ
jgi:hypothetical protein